MGRSRHVSCAFAQETTIIGMTHRNLELSDSIPSNGVRFGATVSFWVTLTLSLAALYPVDPWKATLKHCYCHLFLDGDTYCGYELTQEHKLNTKRFD
jgi:hypothetical protein